MSEFYYAKKDLADFPNIGEFAPDEGKAFFDYYGKATSEGKLDLKTKALIALTVATTQNCPYCIDATTNKCLNLGITKEEMMEALHVGAVFMAGATLAHTTQMRKIIKEKE